MKNENRLADEQLISLTEAPNRLPKRNGKRVHYSTVFRWATKGVRGSKLESILIGGVRYTSEESLRRFSARQAIASHSNVSGAAEILDQLGL